MDWEKYRSRKLGVTVYILIATTVLAILKVMTPEVAGVFTGVGIAYNAAQGYLDSKKA